MMKAKIQGISANNKCQLCQEKDETVLELKCKCSKIAQTDCKIRHDREAKLVHWSLCKKISLASLQKPVGTSGREGVRKWGSQNLNNNNNKLK